MSSTFLSTEVWSKQGVGTISKNAFYGIIGACLSWGFILTFIVSNYTENMRFSTLEVFGLGLGLPIVGMLLSSFSKNALLSLLGYHFIVIGLGAILGPMLLAYEVAQPGVVQDAALYTATITALMTIAATTYPKFFEKIGGMLFIVLIAYFITSLVFYFLNYQGIWMAYIGAGLFSLYIGYDFYRANQVEPTADNAIDISCALYIDIINLFLNILRILGNNK